MIIQTTHFLLIFHDHEYMIKDMIKPSWLLSSVKITFVSIFLCFDLIVQTVVVDSILTSLKCVLDIPMAIIKNRMFQQMIWVRFADVINNSEIISTINGDINSNTANIETQYQKIMATITNC